MKNDEVNLTLVHPKYVDHCWIDAGRYLKLAADESFNRYTIFDIYRDIMSGSQHLWILFRGDDEMIAALTTSFVSYPNKNNLCVMFMGSDSPNGELGWVRYRDVILGGLEKFAREHSCDALECTGRRGWERLLSPYGWGKAFTVLEKDLRDQEEKI